LLRDYLINFARSFIYTTALPEHSLLCIQGAYALLADGEIQEQLRYNIMYFNKAAEDMPGFIPSRSAIHCLVLGNNAATQLMERRLWDAGFYVKDIKSPTVKAGAERLRICVHAYNTPAQIDQMLAEIRAQEAMAS